MKKFISTSLIMLLIGLTAGCSGSVTPEATADTSSAQTATDKPADAEAIDVASEVPAEGDKTETAEGEKAAPAGKYIAGKEGDPIRVRVLEGESGTIFIAGDADTFENNVLLRFIQVGTDKEVVDHVTAQKLEKAPYPFEYQRFDFDPGEWKVLVGEDNPGAEESGKEPFLLEVGTVKLEAPKK